MTNIKNTDLIELLATIIYHKNYCGVGVNKKADFYNKKNIYMWLSSLPLNITLLINKDYVDALSAEWENFEQKLNIVLNERR